MMQFHWPGFDSLGKLSVEETAELAARVAELTRAGLPLGDGLRALAGELAGRRLRRTLLALADRLDAGMELAEALEPGPGRETRRRGDKETRRQKNALHPPRLLVSPSPCLPVSLSPRLSVSSARFPALPAHLRGLLLAGLRSGRLAEVLEEYVDLQRSQAELRRRVMMTLSYPIIILFLLTGLTFFGNLCVVDGFVNIYKDFGMKLPDITIIFLHLAWPTAFGLILLLFVILAIPISLTVAPQARWIWPVLHGIPLIGPLLRWSHLAQFARLMGLLLEQHVPLPDALRLTADGLRDADLAHGCRRVAERVDDGDVLYESMAAEPQFPPSLIPIVEWGQRVPALADAFHAAAEMFEGRLHSQGSILEALVLPFILALTLCMVGAIVFALFLPFCSIMVKLSG